MEEYSAKRTELRQQMKNRRDQLSGNDVEKYSNTITRRLTELEPVRKANNIMCYSGIRNEVDLKPLIESQSISRTVLLPRTKKNGDMEAVKFTDWEHTRRSAYGILEPEGDAYPLDKIDVVIVPGLVFDFKGYRLGYGKGYYDRFLKQLHPGAFICGAAYEFQVVERVFPHEHDLPVHWIVTEKSELVINWDYF